MPLESLLFTVYFHKRSHTHNISNKSSIIHLFSRFSTLIGKYYSDHVFSINLYRNTRSFPKVSDSLRLPFPRRLNISSANPICTHHPRLGTQKLLKIGSSNEARKKKQNSKMRRIENITPDLGI